MKSSSICTTLHLLITYYTHNVYSQTSTSAPNVLFILLDDMPFITEWTESAPNGNELIGLNVTIKDYDTPNINAFRDEAVIFSKSYCSAPKCAPSRYSVLTGRQTIECEHAIDDTLSSLNAMRTGVFGTTVSISSMKMNGMDSVYNIPTVLRDNGYYTGMVGKWHLMPDDDNGHFYNCSSQEIWPNRDLYGQCKDILHEVGFDHVEAWYWGNIKENEFFSHNPEWMVDEARKMMVEALDGDQPFFLYFASTLVHTPDVVLALTEFTSRQTPMGQLEYNPGDRISMWPRSRFYEYALAAAAAANADGADLDEELYISYLWMDHQFGALMNAVEGLGVYDDTLVILQNDHGQIAKGLLYEQGTRILNFQRYPDLFGVEGPMVLPQSIVTSNVDLAATIFELAGITPPDEYQLDGISYLDDVLLALSTDTESDTEFEGTGQCQYRYLDVKNSHSIVSERYQYIFRATETVDSMDGVDELYPDAFDLEQLYDLSVDPNQRENIFNDDTKMEIYSEQIATFRVMMREYLDVHCIAIDGGECVKPEDPSPTEAASECDGSCCDDDDCRGYLVCNDGECGRATSTETGSGSSCSSDDTCRGTLSCIDGICQRENSGKGSGSWNGGTGSAAMEISESTMKSSGSRRGGIFGISWISSLGFLSYLWLWTIVSMFVLFV